MGVRHVLITAIFLAAGAQGTRPGVPGVEACAFKVSPLTVDPVVLGAKEVVQRVRVLRQTDSPVAIVRVDLRQFKLSISPSGSYERSGTYSLDVKNVSDRVLTDVLVTLRVRSEPLSGSGGHFAKPLHPGELAHVEVRSGMGRGTIRGGEMQFAAYVESVEMTGCTYKPSQSWPTTPARRL